MKPCLNKRTNSVRLVGSLLAKLVGPAQQAQIEVTVKVCVIGDNPAKPEGSTVLAPYP